MKTSFFLSTMFFIEHSKQRRQVCLDRLLEWSSLASPTWKQFNKAPVEGSRQRNTFQPRRKSASHLTQVEVRENYCGFAHIQNCDTAVAPPYQASLLFSWTKLSWMLLCSRLPVAAGVFVPECYISPRPSLHWTPALHCEHLTHHWI